MASNYTRLQNIFLELLNHDVDFQVVNTLDGDLVPVKEINCNNFSIQVDLEDMSDDAEDGIYRFFKYADVDGKKEIVSEISYDTMKELEEIVIDWIKKQYKLDVTEIEAKPEPESNEEIWDSIFKKLDAEEKKYIETDLSPWLTETYSEDEKKEYLELKAKAMHMSKEEIYDNAGKYFGIWWRISREELRRRDTNKYRKPKNPPQEYYEPVGCPECGCDLEKQEDGNYHCMCCGYDHNRDRNGYYW